MVRQALAFDQLLSLPELSRQLCLFWGLKTSRAFAALVRSSGSRTWLEIQESIRFYQILSLGKLPFCCW
jgi:hypothetical protein